MNDRVRRDRTPTVLELVFDLLKARLWTILAVVTGAVLVILWLRVDLSVPRWGRLVFFTYVFMLPAGYITGNYLVNLLWDPQTVFLVDFDAREVDGALFAFPFDDFRELDVLDGELCQLTPNLYVGKDVDMEAGTAVGTWHGTLSDRELARALQKVRECRDVLEADARKGFALETSAFVIIEKACRKTALQVIRTFERGVLPDEGEALSEVVDEALAEFDLDKELEDMDLEAPDPAEAAGEAAAPDGDRREPADRAPPDADADPEAVADD